MWARGEAQPAQRLIAETDHAAVVAYLVGFQLVALQIAALTWLKEMLPLIAPFWHLAAVCPNLHGLQEFVYDLNPRQSATWYTPGITVKNGLMQIPDTPGLGISYDESIWKMAERVA